MKKNGNSSTVKRELDIPCSYLDSLESAALLHNPEQADWRKRLIFTMHHWIDNVQPEEALEVLQFCRKYRIPYRTLKYWAVTYPDDIGVAYEDLKLFIACNRRVGSMTKKLDGAYAYKDMHKLDAEWKEIDTYHSNLKKSEAPEPTTFNIVGKLPHPDVISKEEIKKDQEKIL